MTTGTLNRQLLRITRLVQLEQRARRAGAEELGFVMVNETRNLVPYHTAVLWQWDGRNRGRVAALSGAAVPDREGPMAGWLAKLLRALSRDASAGTLRALTAADVDPGTAAGWRDWLPANALWVPLADPAGRLVGALLLARQDPWTEADSHLMGHLGEAYAHAWVLASVRRPRVPWRRRLTGRRLVAAVVLAALAGLGAMPVRQSVLAPAEVVPRTPSLVRAPVDGVVDRIHVRPNETVAAGQILVSLDRRQFETRLAVAMKALELARTEYAQAAQQAVMDPQAKMRLPLLQGRVEQQQTEASYVRGMLERVDIAAPGPGVAIFEDVNDWLGKPVVVGERILMVADPGAVELAVDLPVADAMPFGEGTEVTFFRNVAPDRPVAARVTFVGYRPEPTVDGVLAYRVKASFPEGDGAADGPLRIGLQGTAKIHGPPAPLVLSLLRRPIAMVRQWLTL